MFIVGYANPIRIVDNNLSLQVVIDLTPGRGGISILNMPVLILCIYVSHLILQATKIGPFRGVGEVASFTT